MAPYALSLVGLTRDQLVDFVCFIDSVLVLLLIPHFYLISELILDLYVFYDGALMCEKSCTQIGSLNVIQPQQNLGQLLYMCHSIKLVSTLLLVF